MASDRAEKIAYDLAMSLVDESYSFKALAAQIDEAFDAIREESLKGKLAINAELIAERARSAKLAEALMRIEELPLRMMHDDRQQEVLVCWPSDNPKLIAHVALAEHHKGDK